MSVCVGRVRSVCVHASGMQPRAVCARIRYVPNLERIIESTYGGVCT